MKINKKLESWEPSSESVNAINQAIEKVLSHQKKPSEWLMKYCQSHKLRLAYDLDYIKDLNPGKEHKILEVGAMPFLLTLALQQLGYSITGIDINPERMQEIISTFNLKIHQCDIEHNKLPFSSNSFDIILFNEVFEHLRINPIYTLEEIYRVLKPNGTLLLSTPNLLSFKGWLSLLLHGKPPGNIYYEYLKLRTIGHMGHVREYTSKEVSEFLIACGFQVKDIIYRGLPTSKNRWKQLVARTYLTIFFKQRRYFSVVCTKSNSI